MFSSFMKIGQRVWCLRIDSEQLKYVTDWVKSIRQYKDINELNREILLELINQITVLETGNNLKIRIVIECKYNAF